MARRSLVGSSRARARLECPHSSTQTGSDQLQLCDQSVRQEGPWRRHFARDFAAAGTTASGLAVLRSLPRPVTIWLGGTTGPGVVEGPEWQLFQNIDLLGPSIELRAAIVAEAQPAVIT